MESVFVYLARSIFSLVFLKTKNVWMKIEENSWVKFIFFPLDCSLEVFSSLKKSKQTFRFLISYSKKLLRKSWWFLVMVIRRHLSHSRHLQGSSLFIILIKQKFKKAKEAFWKSFKPTQHSSRSSNYHNFPPSIIELLRNEIFILFVCSICLISTAFLICKSN